MYFNRDLSWLGFNDRVLQEAEDEKMPLYERLKFLAIFSSNLDEFFRVRYPGIAALAKLNKKSLKKEGVPGDDMLDKIQAYINGQLNRFGYILNEQLLPELKKNKIHFYYNQPILPEHQAEIKEIFLSKVLSFIQPVFLGPDVEYNFKPENNELYFIVTLKEEFSDTLQQVAVNIPSKKLSRFFVLGQHNDEEYVIFIDDIIRENMQMVFPGHIITGIHSIKFNRDAEINLYDEFTGDLLEKIEKKLSKRNLGTASRLLFEKGTPRNVQLFLSSLFKIHINDLFEGGRYHNLSDLFGFPVLKQGLTNPKVKPLMYPKSAANGDIFKNIDEKDILLHLPYQSYNPVLTFFNQAAVDPSVTEIYITLYRVATESHIVNALISAAKNGKKVTAFIELKARFDEANNIRWSRVMKQAGVKLIYSDPSVKVHSKIGLVRKKLKGEEKIYSVISTGNFNESTASFYTDHVLFTAKKKLGAELLQLFEFLQKKDVDPEQSGLQFKSIYVARFNFLSSFEKLVQKEINKAEKGKTGLIRIKVNNLEEPEVIDLLYKASQAGVRINLLVRSICCIIPGVTGQSENIIIHRIVDKYLEHSRLYMFGEDEDAIVWMGSSDLMIRNIRRRIEVCVEVKDEDCKRQLLDYFDLQWSDNTKAVQLNSELENIKIPLSEPAVNAQSAIYEYLKNAPGVNA